MGVSELNRRRAGILGYNAGPQRPEYAFNTVEVNPFLGQEGCLQQVSGFMMIEAVACRLCVIDVLYRVSRPTNEETLQRLRYTSRLRCVTLPPFQCYVTHEEKIAMH